MSDSENSGEQKIELVQVKKHDDIYNILIKFDKIFDPPISKWRELKAFSRKLEELANVYAAKSGEEILGFTAFYANDYINNTAFGLFFGVLPRIRNKGIGHLLIDVAVRKAKEQGITKFKIEVYKKNVNAINIYKKIGFSFLAEKNEEFDYMIKEL